MKPHLKCVEGIMALDFDNDLAIDDELRRLEMRQPVDKFGKISAEGLARLSSDIDRFSGFESQEAKAIPLGFVLPPSAGISSASLASIGAVSTGNGNFASVAIV
jgi:hypothetical protein